MPAQANIEHARSSQHRTCPLKPTSNMPTQAESGLEWATLVNAFGFGRTGVFAPRELVGGFEFE
jgi:hypothetical protein